MSTQVRPDVQRSRPVTVLIAVDILIAALWVAICTAAPEFLWRGAQVIVENAEWGDLVSALLIGLILAFCIEPAMERFRHGLSRGHHKPAKEDRSYNLLFPTIAGFAFAVSSVCIHDAITAFVNDHSGGQGTLYEGFTVGLRAAVHIAGAWTVVPFCICLAWLSEGQRWLRVPLGVLAALSPLFAAWWFDWGGQVWLTTNLPCLVILLAGYRQWNAGPVRGFYRRCAVSVAWIASIWLLGAVLFDQLANLLGLNWADLYTREEFWIDVRFYLGWVIGLCLAPVPLVEALRSKPIGPRNG